MNKIQKISTYVLALSNFLIVAIPVSILLSWIFLDGKNSWTLTNLIAYGYHNDLIQTPEGFVYLDTIHWTIVSKFLAFMSRLIDVSPVFLSCFYLRKIFSHYKNGEIFNVANAKHYSCLGWLFFVDAFLTNPLSHGLMVVVATLPNSVGHRYISLSFGTPNIEALFCGVLVLVISWVMLEGSKIHDEYKLTV